VGGGLESEVYKGAKCFLVACKREIGRIGNPNHKDPERTDTSEKWNAKGFPVN